MRDLAYTVRIDDVLFSTSVAPKDLWLTLSALAALAVTIGLVLVAGVLVGQARAVRHGWTLIVRAGVLVAIAVFVWVRPEVTTLIQPSAFAVAAAAFFAAGLSLPLVVRGWNARVAALMATVDERRVLLLLIVVAIAGVRLATRVAEHWDVSGFMDSRTYDTYGVNIATGKDLAGSSAYMPLYQYGLGFVYYIAGHFFFVQQIVNLVLACAAILALGRAAWLLYGSAIAGLAAGLVAAFAHVFVYAVFFTQIESWYLPVTSLILLAWARYWTAPSMLGSLWLAVALGLGMNMRNQGALFFAFMAASPLAVPQLHWRQRLAQTALIGLIVVVSLVPWTIRNYVVEGRLSPSASRSALYLGALTDHRIGLYGIRYWEGWNEVATEFEQRYPQPAAREAALVRAMWTNVTSDPIWLVKAFVWRSASFYGVLPDSYFTSGPIVPTDWRAEWRRYLYWRTTPLLLLALTPVALALRFDRTTLFLVGAAFASLGINLVSASPEARLGYPVLLIHILLVVSLFGDRIAARPTHAPSARAVGSPLRRWAIAAAAAVIVMVVCRTTVGAKYAYRPLMEPQVGCPSNLAIDHATPLLDVDRDAARGGLAPASIVRVRGMLTNYMYPPKFAGRVEGIPAFATEPTGPQFFYLSGLTPDYALIDTEIGVQFAGAEVCDELREGDAVEIQAEVLSSQGPSGLWLRAQKVRNLAVDRDGLPAFR